MSCFYLLDRYTPICWFGVRLMCTTSINNHHIARVRIVWHNTSKIGEGTCMVGVGSHVGALVSLLRFGYLSTFVYDTFGWLYAMGLKVVFCCILCYL